MDVHPTKNVSIGIDPYPYPKTLKQPSRGSACFAHSGPFRSSKKHLFWGQKKHEKSPRCKNWAMFESPNQGLCLILLDYSSLPRYHIWSSCFWWAAKTFLKRGGWIKPALFEDVTHTLSTCFLVAPSGPNLDSDLQRGRVVKPPWNKRLVCHQPHNSIWVWKG